jgi:hypothetical protein
MSLLTGLKTFDITSVKPDMAKKAKKCIEALKKEAGCDGPDLVAFIKNKSLAASGIYKWAAATD